MNETTTNKKIYSVMNAVQRDLVKTGISKDQENREQHYKFRGIDDVFNTLGPLLAEHKLLILPKITFWECKEFKNVKGNQAFHVKVDAEWHFIAVEDGSAHVVQNYGEAIDYSDKGTNKAMSAAYKYAVIQAFAIPVQGEEDADATTPDVEQHAVLPPASPGRSVHEAYGPGMEGATDAARRFKEGDFVDGDEDLWDVTIQDKFEKTTTKGKPYSVLKLSNGESLSIFDTKVDAKLVKGQRVRLVVKKQGKYWNFAAVEESSEELEPRTRTEETWVVSVEDVTEEEKNGKIAYEVVFDNGQSALTTNKKLATRCSQLTTDMAFKVRRNSLNTNWGLISVEELEEAES